MTTDGPAALPPLYWPPGDGDQPGQAPPGALGHDGGSWFVVDGRSVRTTGFEGNPPLVVNSSAEMFHECMRLFRTAWQQRASLDDAEASEQAVSLRRELGRIDAVAVNGEDTWWSLVLGQMQDGLL